MQFQICIYEPPGGEKPLTYSIHKRRMLHKECAPRIFQVPQHEYGLFFLSSCVSIQFFYSLSLSFLWKPKSWLTLVMAFSPCSHTDMRKKNFPVLVSLAFIQGFALVRHSRVCVWRVICRSESTGTRVMQRSFSMSSNETSICSNVLSHWQRALCE